MIQVGRPRGVASRHFYRNGTGGEEASFNSSPVSTDAWKGGIREG